ncbi:hypothetical protein DN730_17400 [Marinomonas piezotolerans]|uniref:TolC family protein n=1 Tax=Marinomonas piezotolerans TaxID=2213058 RepID=A0A370U502_9GAMM|nr:TolC family protein [Marinomonas piezotolerans]RDL42837.1 hypothetical protein DN730_17400 [Marinomonas piezotolerans]
MRKYLLNGLLLSGVALLPSVSNAQALSLTQFLALQQQQNYQLWQLEVQQKAQRLALEVGEEYWKPSVTAVSNIQNSHTNSLGTSLDYEQWQAGLEASWTSDVGTNLSLSTSVLEGEGLGSDSLAKRQSGRDTSLTLSQPLLKNNTPYFQQLDKRLAQNAWQQFETQRDLSNLSVQRDSLQAFIEFQVAYENWKVQADLLQSMQHTARITEQMMQAEKATPYEVEKALAEVQQQQVEVDSAKVEIALQERAALATLRLSDTLELQPFASLSQLLEPLQAQMLQIDNERMSHHPELKQAELSYDTAIYQQQQQEQDLVPELDLFYRHQKQHFATSPDVENNTYGIRFSYELTNKSTHQTIEALRATADVANLEKAQVKKQLRLSYYSLSQRASYLNEQVAVLAHQVDLAKKGLEQQRSRYKVGRANFYSLENVQQDVLDKQLEWLSALKSLAVSLSQLSYYAQSDIGQIFASNK